MPKENKSSFAEYDRRINKIYELLICGYNNYDIFRYVSEKTEWELTTRQIENYIAEARELIKERSRQTQEDFLEECKNRLSDLYKKAMSEKNLSECRQIMLTANKILGYELLSVKHSGEIKTGLDITKMSKEDMQRIKDNLELLLKE